MRGSNGFEIGRRAMPCILLCAMTVVLFGVCGCGEQLTRMEENQVRLQALVAANAREIATLSSQVHTGGAEINQGLQNLDAKAQGIAADVQSVQSDQKELQETVAAGNQSLETKAAALQEGQQTLQTGVANVHEVAQQTASDLTTLARQHTGLTEMVQANQRELNGHMDVVVSNQQGIQAGVTRLQDADQGLSRDIASLADKQDALSTAMQTGTNAVTAKLAVLEQNQQNHQAAVAAAQSDLQQSLDKNHEQVAGQFASLAQSQQELQTGVQALDTKMGRMSEDAVGATSSLQQTLGANQDTITSQVASLAASQQTLQADIDALNGKADNLTANLTAVSAEQTAAKETSRANHDEIVTAMAGFSDGQQAVRSGLDQVNNKADQIGNGLTSMASDQQSLQETVRLNQETVLGRFSDVTKSQSDLHAGLNALNSKTDVIAAELAAAAERQSTLQQSVAAGNEAVAAHATTVAEQQQNLKAAIEGLGVATHQVSTDVAAVASKQDSFRQMQEGDNQATVTSLAGLADGQRTLRSEVDQLTATTNQTALSMLTLNNGQATFQQAMQTGMNTMNERTDRTSSHVKDMVEQNTALSQSLTAQAAALAENQQTLKTDLGRMANVVDRTYADLTTVSLAQDTLQSTLANRGDEIGGRMARLDNNQKELAESLNILTATAGQTALDVMGLATGHAELQRSIRAGSDTMVARTTTLAENQQTLGSQLDVLTETASQTAVDVLNMDDNQVKLAQTVQGGFAGVSDQTATLAQNQQQMQGNLDVLTATAGQTAADVLAVGDSQAKLGRTLQGTLTSLSDQTTALAQNQQQMQGNLDVLTATAGQTAADVLAVGDSQARLGQTLQGGLTSLGDQTAALAQNQQKMQGNLEVLTTTTGQTAADVVTIGDSQAKVGQTLQAGLAGLGTQTTAVAENQQRMQGNLDVLTATAGQTATDVTALNNRQDAIAKAIQSHEESSVNRTSDLAGNQQKMQNGLDTATATLGQTIRDIATLSETQAKSEQTAQAGREQVAARLADIAQNQQGWIERFDAAQARVQAMADSIAAFDQQLGKLQGSLQTGVQNTTTLLDANGQQRQQFEAKIAEDVQAMIDALAQLRQVQAQLQEQMSQVQKSTQSQTETLKATIDQIRQPAAEAKISDAASPAAPVLVQTGE